MPNSSPLPPPILTDWDTWKSTAELETQLQRLLDEGEWENFYPPRDLLPLRKFLQLLAKENGIQDLHRQISEKILHQHGRLTHRLGHLGAIVAQALSPDRRWLATGSWVQDDYEEGGQLMIWEVATGRCVNIISHIPGGIGWPDYADCMQWSPNGQYLGMAFNTNSVGVFAPFAQSRKPIAQLEVTDGWSRPPAWCWSPDSQKIMVAAWGDSEVIPGCICSLDQETVYPEDAQWFSGEIAAGILPETNLELQPFEAVRWSQDGQLIYGHNAHDQAYGIAVESGQLKYFTQYGAPIAWDPDDQSFAHNLAGLLFYETQTGLPTFKLPMIVGAGEVIWSKVQGQNRLAVMIHPDNRFGADPCVHVYEMGELLCTIEAVAQKASYDDLADKAAWAWSPGGQQGAILLPDGQVQIWAVEKSPVLLLEMEVNVSATGIAWGADSTLIVTSPYVVEFWEMPSGEYRSIYDMELPEGMSIPGLNEAPLWNIDPDFPDQYFVSPCTPVWYKKDFEWITAFPDGKVIANTKLRKLLEEELSYTIGERFSWPWEWTKPQVLPSLSFAVNLWNLPYTLPTSTSKVTKAPAFRTHEVHRPGKAFAKQFAEVRQHAQVKSYALPNRARKSYRLEQRFSEGTIRETSVKTLLGKCVLYAMTNYPNEVEIGALLAVKDDRAYVISHDHSTFSTRWITLSELAYIGAAVPRF